MNNIFFTVQSDYVSRLGLKGGELLVYSLVASFPDGWRLSLSETAELLGMSRRSYAYALAGLQEKGLIDAKMTENGRVWIASAKIALVQNLHQTSVKIAPLASAKFAPLHNNIKNNIKNKEYKVCDAQAHTRTREDEHKGIIVEAETHTAIQPAAPAEEKKKVAPKKKRTADIFTPPTEAEVAAYIAEKGWQVDARHWHAYYTANGWKVGKHTMKDWRAAVKTWQYNGFSNNLKPKSYEQRKQTSGSDNFCGCDTL